MSNNIKDKKNKKEKMPVGQIIKYNFLMLKKIAEMTPQYIVFMFIVGIIGGISDSFTTICTYKLFNVLDMPDASFGMIAVYILIILAINILLRFFYAWYYQYYQTVTDKKLLHKMHAELFEHALKMDLACYDDPKFYNDYVWAMDESKNRAVNVLDDTAKIIKHIINISTLITLMMQVDASVGIILFVGALLTSAAEIFDDKIAFKKNERVKPFKRKNSYINRIYHLSDYAKELRISSAGENLREIYSDSVKNITTEEVHNGRKMCIFQIFNDIISLTSQYLPVVILLFRLYDGTAQLGSFVASINIIWNLKWSMYDFSKNITKMPDNAQYIGKYLKFLSYKPKIVGGKIKAEALETIEMKKRYLCLHDRF